MGAACLKFLRLRCKPEGIRPGREKETSLKWG